MKNTASNTTVCVHIDKSAAYPSASPYHPDTTYPEIAISGTDPSNCIYRMVRNILMDLELDIHHQNTPEWNPFGDFITPGMTVFIKPNTVVHEHVHRGKDLFSLIVHPSVIRPVLDYTCKALDGKGEIIIGDSQLYSSDYDKMLVSSGLGELLKWYCGQTTVSLSWFDLRMNRAKRTWLYGRWARKKIEKDPAGYQLVDLGKFSRLEGLDPLRFRIAIASYKKMRRHHQHGKHEYLFPKSFLKSDVVISIPKLKTHRRTAITLGLKNFMGIPSCKATLPHFMTGSPEEGGDQYIHPSLRKRIITVLHDAIQTNRFTVVKFVCALVKKAVWNSNRIFPFKDNVFEAMWWGNDTLWRTLADLNRAVMYADKQGKICSTVQRRQLVLIDGIIGGEGDGPLGCDAVKSGALFTGFSPVAVDAVAASAMGFDVEKIPLIKKAFDGEEMDLPLCKEKMENIKVKYNGKSGSLEEFSKEVNLEFHPHPQWVGHVER